MKISEITEGLDLYKLSNNPDQLPGYDQMKKLPWVADPLHYIDQSAVKEAVKKLQPKVVASVGGITYVNPNTALNNLVDKLGMIQLYNLRNKPVGWKYDNINQRAWRLKARALLKPYVDKIFQMSASDPAVVKEALNLYKLSKNPEQLAHHNDIKNMPWSKKNHEFIDPEILKPFIKRVMVYNLICLSDNDNHVNVDIEDDGAVDELVRDLVWDIQKTHANELPGWTDPKDGWEEKVGAIIVQAIHDKIAAFKAKIKPNTTHIG